MKAAVFEVLEKMVVREVDDPQIGGDILVAGTSSWTTAARRWLRTSARP